jgi:hypothetical protein
MHLSGKFEGASPLQKTIFPLSFEGEGDKGGGLLSKYLGGEVDKYSHEPTAKV